MKGETYGSPTLGKGIVLDWRHRPCSDNSWTSTIQSKEHMGSSALWVGSDPCVVSLGLVVCGCIKMRYHRPVQKPEETQLCGCSWHLQPLPLHTEFSISYSSEPAQHSCINTICY